MKRKTQGFIVTLWKSYGTKVKRRGKTKVPKEETTRFERYNLEQFEGTVKKH